MVEDAEAAEEEEEDEAAGYRIKNKNPTQRCREKQWKKNSRQETPNSVGEWGDNAR